MRKVLTIINTEKKNVWEFITFLAYSTAAAFLARLGYLETDMIYKTIFAVVTAVLIVNILATLYGLIRK